MWKADYELQTMGTPTHMNHDDEFEIFLFFYDHTLIVPSLDYKSNMLVSINIFYFFCCFPNPP